MASKHADEKRVEAYARALYEAARTSGRTVEDVEQWVQAASFSPEVVETLLCMRDHDDLDLMHAVADMNEQLLEADDSTVMVSVTTAIELNDELRAKIREKCERELKCAVYLSESVDPEILGGVVIEARGRRHDASVRAQLAGIRSALSSAYTGSDE